MMILTSRRYIAYTKKQQVEYKMIKKPNLPINGEEINIVLELALCYGLRNRYSTLTRNNIE